MPGIIVKDTLDFDHIKVKKLHPTFAAEVSGIDFSEPLTREVFAEIKQAINEVCRCSTQQDL